MVRTQIYLPVEYQEELAIMAREQGVPKAVVIRTIIKKSIGKKINSIKNTSPLLSLAKLNFKGGPKDLSSRVDYYLYGEGSK
jgi:3-methyladenine DNA glycosylase Mpg